VQKYENYQNSNFPESPGIICIRQQEIYVWIVVSTDRYTESECFVRLVFFCFVASSHFGHDVL